ncbi:carboxymuconolactone decarboxylase family protein [Diaphorobacter sp. HDW4B]|uniref:carboxymuconolactone decarboxylase family protein n=1 Tax=Diaphorobacter sp. HDW4B TaxID=2714925 RepID=UPI001407FBBD|nr:carboxymuconolactone decarboxylase family protein [Diaphorobacter sp. HDW4B]QIL69375.1 carboxymuconolactone decarboxylase family protein [Diaphorobacter sp. HDW4B]
MARIPYADIQTDVAHALADKIVAQRGSILHLYQMLLHSPAVAEGWLAYLTSIRQRSSLNGGLRELVIMRVAMLNSAPYEADQHAPIALSEGVSEGKLAGLADWPQCALFDPLERSVLAYVDVMTQQVQVADEVFAAVAVHFTPQGLVDLTATIAAYNMVSRFLEALQIHSHDAR